MNDPRAVFVDSNVLIYASIAESPFHAAAISAVERLDVEGNVGWISRQVVREYLVHMTRPDVLGTRAVADLLQQVEMLGRHYEVADENQAVADRLIQLVYDIPVGGKKIHDANIVATCLAYGIPRLLTQNRSDFQRFDHLVHVETLSG